jgi:hypothetical protein
MRFGASKDRVMLVATLTKVDAGEVLKSVHRLFKSLLVQLWERGKGHLTSDPDLEALQSLLTLLLAQGRLVVQDTMIVNPAQDSDLLLIPKSTQR